MKVFVRGMQKTKPVANEVRAGIEGVETLNESCRLNCDVCRGIPDDRMFGVAGRQCVGERFVPALGGLSFV